MEKIYKIARIKSIRKIALEQQMLLPNMGGTTADMSINLQNMQAAQFAVSRINDIIAASAGVNAAIDELEKTTGTSNGEIKKAVSVALFEVLKSNDSVALLMKMNLLPNVDSLFNKGDWDRISLKITNDIQKIQSAQTTQQTTQAGQTNQAK